MSLILYILLVCSCFGLVVGLADFIQARIAIHRARKRARTPIPTLAKVCVVHRKRLGRGSK
jgi:hypothetical protein